MQFLTEEHIKLIHLNAIEEFGGDSGYFILTNDRIESILAQQYPIFGHDKYPTVFQKAAMLMYFFIKGHCFVDGNKRVGIQSAIVFLDVNGYDDKLIDEEGYRKTIEVATIELSEMERDSYVETLAVWLSERFIKC